MHEENKIINLDQELIEKNIDNDKKLKKVKEEKRKYRNKVRDSILSYEIILWDLENKLNDSSSGILSKKSEDDLSIKTNRKNIIHETKRENKSVEKDNKNINLQIRKSLLTDLDNKIQNFYMINDNIKNTDEYRNGEDVKLIK